LANRIHRENKSPPTAAERGKRALIDATKPSRRVTAHRMVFAWCVVKDIIGELGTFGRFAGS
jgi:hypothetical protein